jgi:hypothetical protein
VARRVVAAGGLLYNFSTDGEIPAEGRTRALLRARVIDELTGAPPLETVTLESDMDFSFPRMVEGGIAGLVGMPREIFPPLAMKNYLTRLIVRAQGYISHQRDVTILQDQRTIAAPTPVPPPRYDMITVNDLTGLRVGQTLLVGPLDPTLTAVRIAALDFGTKQITIKPELSHAYAVGDPVVVVVPDDFIPADAGDFLLHRRPVVIRGRTVSVNGTTATPLPGTRVFPTGFWEMLPPAEMSVASQPPNFVALQPSLYLNRSTATASLRRREMLATLGNDKHLLEFISPGSARIKLSDRINLFANDVIAVDADDPDRHEFLTVASINGASTPDQPAEIILTLPLANAHRQSAVVRKVTPQAPGADNAFDREAISGDVCVFLTGLTDLDPANVVEIIDGANPDEYHSVSRFVATSDANGYFRLPPLSRVAQLEIQADHAGPPARTITQIFSPNYSQRENRLELMLR